MKYRKKPIVIEAFQYLPDEDNNFVKCSWFKGRSSEPPERFLIIETLEGNMIALPGDWIIKGIKGEQYPCKDSIFTESYEKVEKFEKEVEDKKEKVGDNGFNFCASNNGMPCIRYRGILERTIRGE